MYSFLFPQTLIEQQKVFIWNVNIQKKSENGRRDKFNNVSEAEKQEAKINVFGDLRKQILIRTMEKLKSQSCWHSPTCSGVGGTM